MHVLYSDTKAPCNSLEIHSKYYNISQIDVNKFTQHQQRQQQ